MKQPFWNNVVAQPTNAKYVMNNPSYIAMQSAQMSLNGRYVQGIAYENATDTGRRRIHFFDTWSRTLTGTWQGPTSVYRPWIMGYGMSADGSRTLAGFWEPSTVYLIDNRTATTITSIADPGFTSNCYLSADGQTAFISTGNLHCYTASTMTRFRIITGYSFCFPSFSGNIAICTTTASCDFVNPFTGAVLKTITKPTGTGVFIGDPTIEINDQYWGREETIAGVKYFRRYRMSDDSMISSVTYPDTNYVLMSISYDLSMGIIYRQNLEGSAMYLKNFQTGVEFFIKNWSSSTDGYGGFPFRNQWPLNYNGSSFVYPNSSGNGVFTLY